MPEPVPRASEPTALPGAGATTSRHHRATLVPLVDQQLAACRRSGASLVVMSISLEQLDAAEQRHGPAIRHRLLQAAWTRLTNTLRASDIAVHVGHDELGAIVLRAAEPAAAVVDARVIAALCAPYSIAGVDIALTARTGFAVYPQAGITGEDLVRAAHEARAADQ